MCAVSVLPSVRSICCRSELRWHTSSSVCVTLVVVDRAAVEFTVFHCGSSAVLRRLVGRERLRKLIPRQINILQVRRCALRMRTAPLKEQHINSILQEMELPIQPQFLGFHISCVVLLTVCCLASKWTTIDGSLHRIVSITCQTKQSACGKATEDFVVVLLKTNVSSNYTGRVGTPR